MKNVLKEFLPPIVLRTYRSFVGNGQDSYGYFGNYATWAEALAAGKGYDAPLILEKVRGATHDVILGKAAFERDSVTFSTPDFNWPLLTHLLSIAAENNGQLSVLDFGGSLGSSFFQNRPYLASLKKVRWSIVEQPAFVAVGKKEFENESLRFYSTVEECFAVERPHLVLLSSVLPYIEKPYELLNDIISKRPRHVLIDRTAFLKTPHTERITLQKVPPKIYDASYPARFFDIEEIQSVFAQDYLLSAQWDLLEGASDWAYERGLLFTLKK